MNEPLTLLSAATAALAPALFIASAVGVYDALRTVRHNTYVHLSRYFWLYVAAPVVALCGLAIPLAVIIGLIGFAAGATPSRIRAITASVLAALILGFEAVGWLAGVRSKMGEAHVTSSGRTRATVFTIAVLLIAILLATVGVAYGVAQLNAHTIRVLAGVATALNVALLPPLIAFLLRDFRFAPIGVSSRQHPTALAGSPGGVAGDVKARESGEVAAT